MGPGRCPVGPFSDHNRECPTPLPARGKPQPLSAPRSAEQSGCRGGQPPLSAADWDAGQDLGEVHAGVGRGPAVAQVLAQDAPGRANSDEGHTLH